MAVQLLPAQQKPAQKWLDQKFSLFIHFGLYSQYGGVYDDKPVTRGYSEQIQSFAGIFSDWYADAAREFNPVNWNPDSIVALVKKAGMRSIVFTSKHHDGFCMYQSKYTDFNIVDATPYKRDLMKELAEACKRGGIDFAVYFSLIDWHFPQAYPISSHNADPLTPEHYTFNLKQVEEIMTNYGPISEIWFDMGSLTAEQSRGLYELVNRLQPECMISGRLGNNYVDFSVMADNEYPDYKIGVPWQTAASMFDETWGYRSWQERGNAQDKVNEKIASLIKVISRGGNYLLNIGPRGDGSVVEFEKEVLLKMGAWTNANAEAIYATKANPFPHAFSWGDITTRDNSLYLFVRKDNQAIDLNGFNGKITDVSVLASGEKCRYQQNLKSNSVQISLPENPENIPVTVLKVSFEDRFTVLPKDIVSTGLLTAENAVPEFGHSSADYYCGYKSLTGYGWHFRKSGSQLSPTVFFTENEQGKNIRFTLDGKTIETSLNPQDSTVVKTKNAFAWGNQYRKKGKGVFGYVEEENRLSPEIDTTWKNIGTMKYGERQQMELRSRESLLVLQEIQSSANQDAAIEISSGCAAYIILNGKYITAYFPTPGVEFQKKILVLPVKKGNNQLIIKFFNRNTEELMYSLKPLEKWTVYRMKLPSFNLNSTATHQFNVKAANPPSKVAPLEMSNIRVRM
ncbi:MAG TPA: alpha-L-fucosidase [Paludibacteraceae bacterium]|nr:alpha-L-fucosidase [Paludibacteraceae bacterium]